MSNPQPVPPATEQLWKPTPPMLIRNARIEYAKITVADHGILDIWLGLDYGGLHQGFGGWSLGYRNDTRDRHAAQGNYAGEFITRVLQITDVDTWDCVVGRTIRAVAETDKFNASVIGIGHVIKDEWWSPRHTFARWEALAKAGVA